MSKAYSGPSLEKVAAEFDYEGRRKVNVDTCPACGSLEREPLAERERHGFPQPSVICMQCGAMYLTPVFTDKEYLRFYASFYRRFVSAFWKQPFGPLRVAKDCRNYARTLERILRPQLRKKAPPISILDVGGSEGDVASRLMRLSKHRGAVTITVIEPTARKAREARAAGLKVIEGFAERVKVPKKAYDLVLLCRTIEHLRSPAAVLDSMRSAVRDGGRVFADYVDFPAIARHRGLRNSLQVDHLCNFTAGTFYPMMARHGFRRVGAKLLFGPERGHVFVPSRPARIRYTPKHAAKLHAYLKGVRQ